ncbi:MAG: nicotinamide mononucleotide transporter [Clostridia bacterium]|nr:nicotinamide mononucleotide transporter [Clostridia bacterium]
MIRFVKGLFKDWKVFEVVYLISSLTIVVTLALIFKSSWLSTVTSVFMLITIVLLARGRLSSQFVSLLALFFYTWLSYTQNYFGEMIINICIMFPTTIYGIVSWCKNSNGSSNFVKVGKIGKLETIILSILSVVMFVAFYFLLGALGTSQLVVSTLSILASFYASYLLARRSGLGFIFYIINDFILMVLWGIATFTVDFSTLPMFVSVCLFTINDFYGFYNWKKQKKLQ